MDADRFDRIARAVAPATARRSLIRAVAAGSLGAGLATLTRPEEALACRKNGKACDNDRPGQCCSGKCAKKNGNLRCERVRGAFGCTTDTDSCVRGKTGCPNRADGLCFVRVNGRPTCAASVSCFGCGSDAECVDEFFAGARCIKCAAECGVTNNRACVFDPEIAD